MKKLNLIISTLLVVFIVESCSTSKQARVLKNNIEGTWQLKTITTEGITGKVKAQVLDEADFNCFVGSTWHFNKSNNLGYYEISKNGNECAAIKRNIRWSIFDEDGTPKMLQFKKVDARYKDMEDGKAGYRFNILQTTDNTMQVKSDITFEGKTASFIYNFVRI